MGVIYRISTMKLLSFAPTLLIFVGQLKVSLCDVNSIKDKIIKDVLTDYSKDIRPAGSVTNRGVKIHMSVLPIHIHVDSTTSTVSSMVVFVFKWNDDRLKWVPANYQNVSKVYVGPDKLWRPDIKVYNSVEHFEYGDTDMELDSTGMIWWFPPTNLRTNCELDWTYWPWDYQICQY